MIMNFALLYRLFKVKVWALPSRVIAVVFFISLLVIPLITTEDYLIRTLILAAIFAIYAASWDVLAGYTGQLNLGQALFFGSGAYTAALLNLHYKLPPLITVPVGGIGAIAIGLIVCLPALRLRGFYLALVTLCFPIIFMGIIFFFSDFTGGELGLFGLQSLCNSRIGTYYIIILTMIASVFVMYKFTDVESSNIRTGIIFVAICEDEISARNSGINTTHYKLLAFAISGFFSGIAGGLYAHSLKIAGPSTLEMFFSLEAIIWTIFGGIRSIYGPVSGVFILYPLMQVLRSIGFAEQIRYVVFSLILIFSLLYMPEGLSVWIRDKIEIRCQRCKVINAATRKRCRSCRALLRLGENDNIQKGEDD
ncbi:MAG: branched-chain amino acid ABC transporter permease [Deltaproteobacteria bacterium]|nr:branched-chain amino acid ABC transporter permease [Deltaproteobacteria bacterium]